MLFILIELMKFKEQPILYVRIRSILFDFTNSIFGSIMFIEFFVLCNKFCAPAPQQ